MHLGPAFGFRSRIRSPLERNRSAHRDPAGRLTPVSRTASPALSLHRKGGSKSASCRQTPLTLQRAATLDLSLFIRVVGEHFKPGATRPSSQFASPVQFPFPDTTERRSPSAGH